MGLGEVLQPALYALAAEHRVLLCPVHQFPFQGGVQHAVTEFGRIGELVIAAERSVAILSRITPEYYLLLLLPADGNVGRGRWELKKAAQTLQRELF